MYRATSVCVRPAFSRNSRSNADISRVKNRWRLVTGNVSKYQHGRQALLRSNSFIIHNSHFFILCPPYRWGGRPWGRLPGCLTRRPFARQLGRLVRPGPAPREGRRLGRRVRRRPRPPLPRRVTRLVRRLVRRRLSRLLRRRPACPACRRLRRRGSILERPQFSRGEYLYVCYDSQPKIVPFHAPALEQKGTPVTERTISVPDSPKKCRAATASLPCAQQGRSRTSASVESSRSQCGRRRPGERSRRLLGPA